MIAAKTVKELRERTGAGFMDCKRALEEVDGDFEKAIEFLRKSGIAKAQKKAGRSTKEGLVVQYIHPGGKLGVLVEINCETDFVARTEGFEQFTKDVAMQIAASSPLVVNRVHPAVEAAKALITANKPQFRVSPREDSDNKLASIWN